MYIEGITLEHFSDLQQPTSFLVSCDLSRHAVFHSFLYDDSKQGSVTTTAHSERIVELLKNRQLRFSDIITILDNKDSCDD